MMSEAASGTGADAGTGSDVGSGTGTGTGPIGLLEGLATTRAIRRYLPDPIPDEDLASILWHASRAPSGSNRQMFRFVVLRDGPSAQQVKALLGQSFRDGWNAKRSGDGYAEGSGAADNSPKARMARTMQHFVDHFEETPVVILACLVRYRQPTYAEGGSVYPAVQNLLLAARALGYGGVITGWHRDVEDELRELLGIPEGVAIHVTIPLGRPAGRHGPVRRRPLRELVYEDRWEQDAPWAVDPPDTHFTSAGPPPGSPV
ncbi:nitroreductase family protein [Candidatus Poriferisodalis sp.]|uniref:nitroreductase family protein n=1 Tax=Candidatus Poriferisodalis sp. TaxID=3101277 RepID=UPI003AF598E7